MTMESNTAEGQAIGRQLTKELGICDCQRKLLSIVRALIGIRDKILSRNLKFSANEVLIITFLDSKKLLTHGVNIEYPILDEGHEFWKWIESIKNNPNLEDN